MAIDPNIKQIKIHPAIGFARLSTSSDYFVFDPADPVRPIYKSGDKIMRQAVQFRLFAYGENNEGLYELTPDKLQQMAIRAIWSAELGNGKIEHQTHNPSDRFHARGDTSGGDLQLVGNLSTFVEGAAIPMGTLNTTGLFVPPEAGVFRRTPTTRIPDHGMFDTDITDNSSDGSINVRLVDVGAGQPVGVSVLPAWVSVCPPDFAPAWDDQDQGSGVANINMLTYLERILQTPSRPPTNAVNRSARELDRNTLKRGSARFGPGIEFNALQQSQFYPVSVTNDPDEIRLMPTRGGSGAAPGGLTDSLCSPWQYDFRACACSWWPNQRPDVAFKNSESGNQANWRRKVAAESGDNPPGGLLVTNADFIIHVDELGIIKKGANDLTKRVETERDSDIADLTA